MTLELFRVPLGASGDSDLIIDFATVERDFLVATLGDDDLADGPKSTAVVWANQRYVTKVWFVARQEGRPVGAVSARLPLTDNKTLAEVELTVTAGVPDHDRVADALWEAVRPELVQAGRSTVQCWAAHALDGPSSSAPRAEWLQPATGVGSLPPDPFALWLGARGFQLEQAERHSVLDVRPALPIAEELAAAARPHSVDAYEVISWLGATPDEYLEPMAVLRSRMSVDVPTAALEAEEEAWDAERVRVDNEASLARGMGLCTTVARDRASGELVAYSVLIQPTDKPAVAYQDDTLVHGEHRGHRLGMLMKTVNLRALHDHVPTVERVHTWNAGENSWMLDINVAMGFTERSAEGAWQLTGLA